MKKITLCILMLLNCSLLYADNNKTNTNSMRAIQLSDEYFVITEESYKDITEPVTTCSIHGRHAYPGDRLEQAQDCWVTDRWSECSSTCGDGVTDRNVMCVGMDGKPSNGCNADLVPAKTKSCHNESKCSHSWSPGAWSACSGGCEDEMSTRSVVCHDPDGNVVDDMFCEVLPRPATNQVCIKGPQCVFAWKTGGWSACSDACSDETSTRDVDCKDGAESIVDESFCGVESKPESNQSCMTSQDCGYLSCSDAFNKGEFNDGVYSIRGHQTMCDMTNGGWTLIARGPVDSAEFLYNGVAWTNTLFGDVENLSAPYLSPLWNTFGVAKVKLVLDGYMTIESSTTTPGTFAKLWQNKTLKNASNYPVGDGSHKNSCSWSQYVNYRFAIFYDTYNCKNGIDYYGLGIYSPTKKDTNGSPRNTPYQVASGRIQDGNLSNDKVFASHSFRLYVKE